MFVEESNELFLLVDGAWANYAPAHGRLGRHDYFFDWDGVAAAYPDIPPRDDMRHRKLIFVEHCQRHFMQSHGHWEEVFDDQRRTSIENDPTWEAVAAIYPDIPIREDWLAPPPGLRGIPARPVRLRELLANPSVYDPAEMVVPGLRARIVEGSHFACLGVGSAGLRTLLLIAGPAGTPQVLADGWPIGSTRNDVLDAKRNATDALISVAVVAAVADIGENLRLELG